MHLYLNMYQKCTNVQFNAEIRKLERSGTPAIITCYMYPVLRGYAYAAIIEKATFEYNENHLITNSDTYRVRYITSSFPVLTNSWFCNVS